MASLKTALVKIGNSQGIRIPKSVLRQIDMGDEIEIEVKMDCLVLKSANKPRAGWDEAFRKAGASPQQPELKEWEEVANDADIDGWTWK